MHKESNHVLINTTNVFHKQYSNICPVLTTVCVEIHTHIHVHTQKHIYAQYTELVIHKWANHNCSPGRGTDMQSRQSCSLCLKFFTASLFKSQLACYPMWDAFHAHSYQATSSATLSEWALSFLRSKSLESGNYGFKYPLPTVALETRMNYLESSSLGILFCKIWVVTPVPQGFICTQTGTWKVLRKVPDK